MNCACQSVSAPVVHVPEELHVELVNGAVDLLPVALHQLRVVHQLLLYRNTTSFNSYSSIRFDNASFIAFFSLLLRKGEDSWSASSPG